MASKLNGKKEGEAQEAEIAANKEENIFKEKKEVIKQKIGPHRNGNINGRQDFKSHPMTGASVHNLCYRLKKIKKNFQSKKLMGR